MESIYGRTKSVTKLLADNQPELWSGYNPPDQLDNPNFPSLKIPAVIYAGNTWRFKQDPLGADDDVQVDTLVANLCAKYGFPAFFVPGSLLNANSYPTLPKDFAWEALDLPFPAATFLLDRNTLKHPTEGNVVFIAYARYLDLEGISLPVLDTPLDHLLVRPGKDQFYILAATENGSLLRAQLDPGSLEMKSVGESVMLSEDGRSQESTIFEPRETAFRDSLLIPLAIHLAQKPKRRPTPSPNAVGAFRFFKPEVLN